MASQFHIAIDGPVAAGKGTVSRLVAERLGFLYVDTGAMYRVTAYLGLQNKVDLQDEGKLVELIKKSKMDMRNPNEDESDGRLTTVILDGQDVSWKIRTEDVGVGASIVAQLPKVREILIEKQQQIAVDKNVVMEGRDITYKVLPEAKLKIYLTGSEEVRAKRRHQQLQNRGDDITFEEVFKELVLRDKRDKQKNLKIVEEAWVLDTTKLEIDEVVDMIVAKAKLEIEN